MIQPARSQNSKSLLRELEFSLVLIKDEKIRSYNIYMIVILYKYYLSLFGYNFIDFPKESKE